MSRTAESWQTAGDDSNLPCCSGDSRAAYSNVVFEVVDDSRSVRPRYRVRNNPSHADYKSLTDAQRPPRVTAKNNLIKTPVIASSNSVSSAFDYIISPVRYIASAFTYNPPQVVETPYKGVKSNDPHRSKQTNKSNKAHPIESKEPDKLKQTDKQNKAHPIESKIETKKLETVLPTADIPLPASDVVVKPKRQPRNIVVSQNPPTHSERVPTHTKSVVYSKHHLTNPKIKDAHSQHKIVKHKTGNDPKKSLSLQIKTTHSKGHTNHTGHKHSGDFHKPQLLKQRSRNDLKIMQFNQISYKVCSNEDHQTSPILMSIANNSSKCPVPLAGGSNKDDVQLRNHPTFTIKMCSNSMSQDWNIEAPYMNRPSFPSEFDQFGRRSRESSVIFEASPISVHDICQQHLEFAPSFVGSTLESESKEPSTSSQEATNTLYPNATEPRQPTPEATNTLHPNATESRQLTPEASNILQPNSIDHRQTTPEESLITSIVTPPNYKNYKIKSPTTPGEPPFPVLTLNSPKPDLAESKFESYRLPTNVYEPFEPRPLQEQPIDSSVNTHLVLQQSTMNANSSHMEVSVSDLPHLIVSSTDMEKLKKYSPKGFTLYNKIIQGTDTASRDSTLQQSSLAPTKVDGVSDGPSRSQRPKSKVFVIRVSSPPVSKKSRVGKVNTPTKADPSSNSRVKSVTDKKHETPRGENVGNLSTNEHVLKVGNVEVMVQLPNKADIGTAPKEGAVTKLPSKENVRNGSSKVNVKKLSNRGNVSTASGKGDVKKVPNKAIGKKVITKVNVKKFSTKVNVQKASSKVNLKKASSKVKSEVEAHKIDYSKVKVMMITSTGRVVTVTKDNIELKARLARTLKPDNATEKTATKSSLPSTHPVQNNTNKADSSNDKSKSKKNEEDISYFAAKPTLPTAKDESTISVPTVAEVPISSQIQTVNPTVTSKSSQSASETLKHQFTDSIFGDYINIDEIFRENGLPYTKKELHRLDPKTVVEENRKTLLQKEETEVYSSNNQTFESRTRSEDRQRNKSTSTSFSFFQNDRVVSVRKNNNQTNEESAEVQKDIDEDGYRGILKYFSPSTTFHGELP